MNFLLRLVERLRLVWLAARGFETGAVSPLPTPLVDPGPDRGRPGRRGRTAGRRRRPGHHRRRLVLRAVPKHPSPTSTTRATWRRLRKECETALATVYQYQAITTSRVAHVRRWRDESDDLMDSARAMMTGIAVREARLEELTIRGSQARAGVDINAEDLPIVAPDDLQWEGETNPLGLFWRLLILIGLVTAELPVQFFVYDYFLSGTTTADVIRSLAVSTAVFMVFGPNVAGMLLRARQATGAERRMGWVVLVLAVPWLFVAVALGMVRGAILNVDVARTARLNITPTTVVLMFVALMLIIGAMSFMLGLARRHPFQEAYVRQRNRRDRLEMPRVGWRNGSTPRTATSPSRTPGCSSRTRWRSGRRTQPRRRRTSRHWCGRSAIRCSRRPCSSGAACGRRSRRCHRHRRSHRAAPLRRPRRDVPQVAVRPAAPPWWRCRQDPGNGTSVRMLSVSDERYAFPILRDG